MEKRDFGQLAAELENYVNSRTKFEDGKVKTEVFDESIDVMPLIGDTIYCPEEIISFAESHKLYAYISVTDNKPYMHVF